MSARFSIIITSYNQRQFIRDAVSSAVALPPDNHEIIVVDDGSTDGSQDVLSEYGDAIRFVPLRKNHGKGGARNSGAALANGQYLVFLDGDDTLLPWALDVYERVADTRKPVLILATMSWFEGELPNAPISRPHSARIVEYHDYFSKDRPFAVSASSVVIERSAFEAVGGWSDLPVMQDQELVIRLGTAGRAVHVLAPPTTNHRAHSGQSIRNVKPFLAALNELLRKERCGEFPGGSARRIDRAAVLGGLGFFWSRRALTAGLPWSAAKLFFRTSVLVAVAVLRRLRLVATGRRAAVVMALRS